MIVIGIDPGLANGIGIIDADGALLFAGEIDVVVGGAKKRLAMGGFGDLIAQHRVTLAIVEATSAMPKQGVSSTYKFGRAVGAFEGALAVLRVPTLFVPASTWKRVMGIAATKDDARAAVLQRWPSQAALFSRVRDHDRAEACLLALYGLQQERRRIAA